MQHCENSRTATTGIEFIAKTVRKNQRFWTNTTFDNVVAS